MDRLLVGLAVGSGLEGVDAAAVRVTSIGLDLAPTVVASASGFPFRRPRRLSPVSRRRKQRAHRQRRGDAGLRGPAGPDSNWCFAA